MNDSIPLVDESSYFRTCSPDSLYDQSQREPASHPVVITTSEGNRLTCLCPHCGWEDEMEWPEDWA